MIFGSGPSDDPGDIHAARRPASTKLLSLATAKRINAYRRSPTMNVPSFLIFYSLAFLIPLTQGGLMQRWIDLSK
jgi:hypothetical protein